MVLLSLYPLVNYSVVTVNTKYFSADYLNMMSCFLILDSNIESVNEQEKGKAKEGNGRVVQH